MPYKANIKLPNVRAYEVTRFDLRLGEKATVDLTGSDPVPIKGWFSNSDPVLDIQAAEDGKSAVITAASKGTCEIQIQKADRTSHLVLAVEVFDEVAASLNLGAGQPVLKDPPA